MNTSVKKRNNFDRIAKLFFLLITILCASIIVIIVAFIFIRGIKPFVSYYEIDSKLYKVDFLKFISGDTWETYPNVFSIGFLIVNTFYIIFFSLLFAVPSAIFMALFIVRIAAKKVALGFTFVVEILASIPSIIYGVFGRGVVTKLVDSIAGLMNIQTPGGLGTLTSSLVLGMMIFPTITLVSITSIKAVKKDIINASLALGASTTQTNFKIVLRSALGGIFSGIILGVGRALGEATAITMVSGNVNSGPSFGLFEATRTLTTTMLSGFKESEGLKYDIRFSVGIVLIFIILITNFLLKYLNKKISEKL